ncbi:MAG: hypothetical protein NTZ21_15600 [Actinobacteria bacterium]|nr:hypothetical protein [Actinomycetota bacterium]
MITPLALFAPTSPIPPIPPAPDGSLQETLTQLLGSDSTSNPALDRLLDDYAASHATLAVVGGGFLLVLLLLTAFCWRQRRRSRADGAGPRTFEYTTYGRLGLMSLAVSALLAVVVAANLGNALDSRPGFAGVVTSLGSPPASGSQAEVQLEFSTWLASGDAATPPPIDERIDDRLAWQFPKAVITAVLLALMATVGARTWRGLLQASRVPDRPRAARDRVQRVTAFGSVPVCLVLMLMVMGNTQASVAPLTMTMLFG